MSNSFSPYIYQISELKSLSLPSIDECYNDFTLLVKPDTDNPSKPSRNVYKVSLAQMLHYFNDFGLGYNSVCSTTVIVQQQFSSAMYVNRHGTNSPKRPATIADFKKKVLDIVNAMIAHVVQSDGMGVEVADTVYPKCIFTLDEMLDVVKLKQLTGRDYIEIKDFTDFAYANSGNPYSMPKYQDGYIPADEMLMCPQHNHGYDKRMKKSIKYQWCAKLKPNGKTIWWRHAWNVGLTRGELLTEYDNVLTNIFNLYTPPGQDDTLHTSISTSCTPNWEYPAKNINCYDNNPVYPINTVETNGSKQVSIRWPGRKYRLFKLEEV